MYNNSLQKLNPISGVQIHLKHELRQKFLTHNTFAMLKNVAKTPNLPYNYISRARSR